MTNPSNGGAGVHGERQPNLLRGAIAGLIGGLLGTYAMSHAQGLWSRTVDGAEPVSAAGRHDARDWQERSEDQNANELAAQAVGSRMLGRYLTEDELQLGAAVLHYAFGAAVGTLYGVLAETTKPVSALGGAAYGTAVWVVADEIAVPAVGLSGPPSLRTTEMHAQALAAHVVYGIATDAVRRAVRAVL